MPLSHIDDHHFKEEELKSVGDVKNLFSNCSEMLTLGTFWEN